MNICKTKKSQISYFLIIAVVLIIAASFVFYIKSSKIESSTSISKLPFETAPIKKYVESCINDLAIPGVYLLASKGGYIYSYENALNTEHEQVAYHLEFEKESAPSKEFMEQELSRFIKESLNFCIWNFEEFNYYGLEIGQGEIKAKIFKNEILIDADYPLTIKSGSSKITISDFKEIVPIRLGYILDVKNRILSNIKNNNLDLGLLSSFGVEVNVLPYDRNNIVYSIYDNQSSIANAPFFFNFATKIEGNSAPELEFIPDFVLTAGKEFTYDVNATDADDDVLSFSANKNFVGIDKNSGVMAFKPQNTGLLETEVCVADQYMAKDCRNVKFMVENE
ncbi:hypothetical protein HY637_01160 [Candidatus Woesearchaeota archaeon]|nr:hypothetical protein [Candidatus Woesearchaeota archaeon]